MNLLQNLKVLKGKVVDLIPMEEFHFAELQLLATEPRIWEFIPIDMSSSEKCKAVFESAVLEKKKGSQLPFVIFHKVEQRLIGSTRILNVEAAHRKMEIGWTWLHPDHWASAVNLECKLLLLTHCFEVLKAIRVQLRTDENNIRSRKAIVKIGGQFEGIFRNDMIRSNGTFRNSAYFSIVETEWTNAKAQLEKLLDNKMELYGDT